MCKIERNHHGIEFVMDIRSGRPEWQENDEANVLLLRIDVVWIVVFHKLSITWAHKATTTIHRDECRLVVSLGNGSSVRLFVDAMVRRQAGSAVNSRSLLILFVIDIGSQHSSHDHGPKATLSVAQVAGSCRVSNNTWFGSSARCAGGNNTHE
jgi:hypothetical protein